MFIYKKSELLVYVRIGVWRYLTESGQQPTLLLYNVFYWLQEETKYQKLCG